MRENKHLIWPSLQEDICKRIVKEDDHRERRGLTTKTLSYHFYLPIHTDDITYSYNIVTPVSYSSSAAIIFVTIIIIIQGLYHCYLAHSTKHWPSLTNYLY